MPIPLVWRARTVSADDLRVIDARARVMKDVIAPLANAAGRVAANDGGRCLRINRTADAR
jgi:hypothetical protein